MKLVMTKAGLCPHQRTSKFTISGHPKIGFRSMIPFLSITGFKYKKDSVLVVTDAEYEKCHSTNPVFFSNNGDRIFLLDHPGLFYFISGVAGHCERGQKMIIKVLEPEHPAPPSNQNSSSAGTPDTSGAVEMATITIMQFIMSLIGILI